jgi:hypothetical protein
VIGKCLVAAALQESGYSVLPVATVPATYVCLLSIYSLWHQYEPAIIHVKCLSEWKKRNCELESVHHDFDFHENLLVS